MPEAATDSRGTRTIGAFLRQAREARGLTLDDAAVVTRIGKNYLMAIEEEAFDKLPSVAYVKGFLRVYAGYLGLSGDEAIALYERAAPARTAKGGEPNVSPDGREAEKRSSRGRWIVPLVLLALVVAAAYLFGERDERPKTTSAAPSVPLPVEPRAAVQPIRTSAAPPPRPVAVDSPREPLAPRSDTASPGIILRMKVNQDGPLTITIDDNISQRYELKAGDFIEWKAERAFTLDLGNAGGVEADLNGRPLKPFGENGKPAHVVLKDNGPAQ